MTPDFFCFRNSIYKENASIIVNYNKKDLQYRLIGTIVTMVLWVCVVGHKQTGV